MAVTLAPRTASRPPVAAPTVERERWGRWHVTVWRQKRSAAWCLASLTFLILLRVPAPGPELGGASPSALLGYKVNGSRNESGSSARA